MLDSARSTTIGGRGVAVVEHSATIEQCGRTDRQPESIYNTALQFNKALCQPFFERITRALLRIMKTADDTRIKCRSNCAWFVILCCPREHACPWLQASQASIEREKTNRDTQSIINIMNSGAIASMSGNKKKMANFNVHHQNAAEWQPPPLPKAPPAPKHKKSVTKVDYSRPVVTKSLADPSPPKTFKRRAERVVDEAEKAEEQRRAKDAAEAERRARERAKQSMWKQDYVEVVLPGDKPFGKWQAIAEDDEQRQEMSNLSICVVGAGVAGLSTAHVLHEQYASAQLTIVSDAPFEQITSFGPAGMFRPYIDEYMYVSGFWVPQVHARAEIGAAQHCVDSNKSTRVIRRPLSESSNVHFKHEHVTSLADVAVDYDIVVNATGLASATLADDSLVRPNRGVLIGVCVRTIDCWYMGVTRDPGNYSRTITDADRTDIRQRCTRMLPALQVVHNYGHAGHGFELSWGCATDAGRQLVTHWKAGTARHAKL
ncbi:unnamed protein product [Sphagnum balticum]